MVTLDTKASFAQLTVPGKLKCIRCVVAGFRHNKVVKSRSEI